MSKRPARTAILILSAVVFLVIGCVVLGAAIGTNRPAKTVAAATPTPTTDPFDRAGFDAYWNSGIIPSTRSLVTSVDWTSGVLTAHTKLFAKADTVEPATKICNALSVYWTQAGKEFHPVRVVDGAEQILTSKHTAGDTCRWRR